MASAAKKCQAKRDHSIEDPPPAVPLRQSPRKKASVVDTDDRRCMDPHDLSDINILATVASLASGLAENRPRSASLSHTADADSQDPHSGSGKLEQTGVAVGLKTQATSASCSSREGRPPTKRALQSMEKIPLRMLMRLPLKTCVDLFSETLPSRNIYQSKIVVQCSFFTDGSCKEQFEGYRDQEQVKKNLQAHIQSHLNYLKAKGQDDFTTNSVQFRQKKTVNESKKVVPSKVSKKRPVIAESENLASSDQDSQQSTSSSSSKESIRSKQRKPKTVIRSENLEPTSHEQDKENEPEVMQVAEIPPPKAKKPAPKRKLSGECDLRAEPESTLSKSRKKTADHGVSLEEEEEESSSSTADSLHADSMTEEMAVLPVKRYPLCDHDYALSTGAPTRLAAGDEDEVGGSESESISSEEETEENVGIRHYESIGAPMVSSEITYSEEEELLKKFLMGGKREMSEEEFMGSGEELEEEDDGDEIVVPPPSEKKQRRPALPRNRNEPIPEWERKLALRCIRELKQRKKDEKQAFICKICNPPRKFTAGATLTYHYRSHAGMKPFKCTIANCPGAFTRMHSLNYHIMIHLNKSRFTCNVCERKFRHPSHFAEHKRKHTGECPFHCDDCNSRFKTRNTYKRHLKTRHGKLLSAAGITDLPPEEAELVKTKPYKKSNSNASSPSYDYDDDFEPLPGPSKQISPPLKSKGAKKKVTPTRTTAGNSGRKSDSSMTSLPPVSTLLPPHNHGAVGVTRSMSSSESMVVSKAKSAEGPIHILPSFSSITPGPVLSSPTHLVTVSQALPTSAQLLFMTAPPAMVPGQLVMPQTYYTVAFPVGPPIPQPPQANSSSATIDEGDSVNYKAVGYVTH